MDTQELSGPEEPCRTKVNPFDFFSELLRENSDQVIHMVLNFDGRLDQKKMQCAVMEAIIREPVCKSRLVEANDTLWWDPSSSLHTRDYFSVLQKTDLDSALADTLSEIIDPTHGPQLKVFLLQSIEGMGDVLVINASHVAMDGSGLKDMARLIMRLYHHPWEGSSCTRDGKPGLNRELPLISTLLPYSDETEGKDWHAPARDPWTFPAQSIETQRQVLAIMMVPGPRVASIHTKRRELGVTVNDLMLAVVALACANLEIEKNQPERSFLNTIDMRRYCTVSERSVTNYSTAFEVRIPVRHTDTLSSLCGVVHEIMENKKRDCPGRRDALDAERLWKSGVSTARETLRNRETDPENHEARIPIFTNTGIINLDQTNHWSPHVTNACLLPCHAPPPAIFIAVSTFMDTMTISVTYHRPAVADEQVRLFFEQVHRILPGYPGEDDTWQLQFVS